VSPTRSGIDIALVSEALEVGGASTAHDMGAYEVARRISHSADPNDPPFSTTVTIERTPKRRRVLPHSLRTT